MFKIRNIILLIMAMNLTKAETYKADKNGNLIVNIIDGKVIVNGKVVKTIKKGEEINIDDLNVSKLEKDMKNLEKNMESVEKELEENMKEMEKDFFK